MNILRYTVSLEQDECAGLSSFDSGAIITRAKWLGLRDRDESKKSVE
jgi:hypothetical protein